MMVSPCPRPPPLPTPPNRRLRRSCLIVLQQTQEKEKEKTQVAIEERIEEAAREARQEAEWEAEDRFRTVLEEREREHTEVLKAALARSDAALGEVARVKKVQWGWFWGVGSSGGEWEVTVYSTVSVGDVVLHPKST